MELPDAATLEWVEAAVGPFQVLSRFAHEHGYSRLWRLEAGGGRVWLKMHAHPHKWAGEVHALTRWKAPLAPTLLAHREAPCAVLLTEVPGVDAETIEFAPEAEARLWSEAGAWLKAFHARTNGWIGNLQADGAPHGEPTQDPCLHVRASFDKRLFQGRERGLLSAEEFDFARAAFEAGLPSLEGATAHSVHRDFHPRNWTAHPDGTLAAVIDFEHARWDVRAADLNRPWDKEFHRDPRLIDAFYEAYGQPDERTKAQIQTMRLFNVVCGLVWAAEVGEGAFSEFNRAALHRLKAT